MGSGGAIDGDAGAGSSDPDADTDEDPQVMRSVGIIKRRDRTLTRRHWNWSAGRGNESPAADYQRLTNPAGRLHVSLCGGAAR